LIWASAGFRCFSAGFDAVLKARSNQKSRGQVQPQIRFGNDNKENKSKGKSKLRGFFAALRMTRVFGLGGREQQQRQQQRHGSGNGNGKGNGKRFVAGGLLAIPPSQSARWMGHPGICGWRSTGQEKRTAKIIDQRTVAVRWSLVRYVRCGLGALICGRRVGPV
jgi:hypothetical protein